MFDPYATKILGKEPQEIKRLQDEGKVTELEFATAAVEGKAFLVEIYQSQGGWTAKSFVAADD